MIKSFETLEGMDSFPDHFREMAVEELWKKEDAGRQARLLRHKRKEIYDLVNQKIVDGVRLFALAISWNGLAREGIVQLANELDERFPGRLSFTQAPMRDDWMKWSDRDETMNVYGFCLDFR